VSARLWILFFLETSLWSFICQQGVHFTLLIHCLFAPCSRRSIIHLQHPSSDTEAIISSSYLQSISIPQKNPGKKNLNHSDGLCNPETRLRLGVDEPASSEAPALQSVRPGREQRRNSVPVPRPRRSQHLGGTAPHAQQSIRQGQHRTQSVQRGLAGQDVARWDN